jgi:membrane protein implicated in regulation of membrane protease activity
MEIERAPHNPQRVSNVSMSGIFWWICQVILTLAGSFFLFFGIHLLIAAYRLKNPFWFIMTFFASNLIILISATILVGIIYRMIRFRRRGSDGDKRLSDETGN